MGMTSDAMGQASGPTAKVQFRVPEHDGSANIETLWAYDLGNECYRLDNSPFTANFVDPAGHSWEVGQKVDAQ